MLVPCADASPFFREAHSGAPWPRSAPPPSRRRSPHSATCSRPEPALDVDTENARPRNKQADHMPSLCAPGPSRCGPAAADTAPSSSPESIPAPSSLTRMDLAA